VPRPATNVVAGLAANARGLSQYLGRVERLSAARQLPVVDVHRAYAGALLWYYVGLERTIQEVFMGLLMGRLTVSRPSVRSLVTIRSESVAREVVRGNRPFVDWLPYSLTQQRAEAFFSRGEPFCALTAQEIQRLEDIRVIRNALAHGGEHAITQFQRRFTIGLPLPPDQRRPAGYLRGQHGVGQTRFAHLLAQSLLVVNSIAR